MRVRETGSIFVGASESEVLELLARTMGDGSLVAPGRIETPGSTYIVRATGDRTQVIHARTGSVAIPRLAQDREALRRAVRSDLFEIQRVFEARASR